MGLGLLDVGELREHVARRLRGGWLLVLGHPACVEMLERTCYPPGTPANEGFELAVLPGMPPVYLALARKRELADCGLDLGGLDLELALAVVFTRASGTACNAMANEARSREVIDKAIEQLLSKLFPR